MNAITLDELDQKIIKAFSQDGRASNRQIAQDLDVTEGTIRTRIKRLQRRGLIHFTTVRSYRYAGSPNLVMMGIHCDQARTAEIADILAGMREIGCVIVMLGRFNILAMGLFLSLDEVNDLILNKIRPIPGVKKVDTSIAVHNVKYNSAVARITSAIAAETENGGDEAES